MPRGPRSSYTTTTWCVVQVLLVEDSKASTSAAALEIQVGNFLDPPHLPGTVLLLSCRT